MFKALGHVAKHSVSRLKPLAFERNEPAVYEVEIDVLFCGVCHLDIRQVEWSDTVQGLAAVPVLLSPSSEFRRGCLKGPIFVCRDRSLRNCASQPFEIGSYLTAYGVKHRSRDGA